MVCFHYIFVNKIKHCRSNEINKSDGSWTYFFTIEIANIFKAIHNLICAIYSCFFHCRFILNAELRLEETDDITFHFQRDWCTYFPITLAFISGLFSLIFITSKLPPGQSSMYLIWCCRPYFIYEIGEYNMEFLFRNFSPWDSQIFKIESG